MHIFTYGSLMFPPVWQAVTTGRYQSSSAVLEGFKRYAVHGEEYPVIIPAPPSCSVPGVVYFSVSGEDIKKLDDFEGSYYLRTSVKVTLESGDIEAASYVLRPEFYALAASEEWDREAFATTGINVFMNRYKGFL